MEFWNVAYEIAREVTHTSPYSALAWKLFARCDRALVLGLEAISPIQTHLSSHFQSNVSLCFSVHFYSVQSSEYLPYTVCV